MSKEFSILVSFSQQNRKGHNSKQYFLVSLSPAGSLIDPTGVYCCKLSLVTPTANGLIETHFYWLCCCCCQVASAVSDSVRSHRWQPTRFPRPWDSPGKDTGVGCHFLLQCMKGKSKHEVAQSCPAPSDPMDCSPPGSSVHGIF